MQLFERVKLVAKQLAKSETKLAELLGLRQKQLNGYLNHVSQRNLWEHLPAILQHYPRISREWLYFGEGDMLQDNASAAPSPIPATPQSRTTIPLIGFTPCGAMGWHGIMIIPVPVEPPAWHDTMLAVMASGESMLPAGLGHGHICYCDPTKTPCAGEAVFVEQYDGTAAIKLFCGKSIRNGVEWFDFQGWLDKTPDNPAQTTFILSVLATQIKRIAPVMYVQRRL